MLAAATYKYMGNVIGVHTITTIIIMPVYTECDIMQYSRNISKVKETYRSIIVIEWLYSIADFLNTTKRASR